MAGSLQCASCAVAFPVVAGVPVLVERPEEFLGFWKAELQREKLQAGQASSSLDRQLHRIPLHPLSRKRLRAIRTGRRSNGTALRNAFAPLLIENNGIDAAPRALGILNPGATSAVDFMLRDWAWGTEPRLLAQATRRLLPPRSSFPLLALGSGACRLLYEIGRLRPGPEPITAIDIWLPLLLLVRKVLHHRGVRLYDVQGHHVRSLGSVARPYLCRAPGPWERPLRLLAADARRLPFAAESWDCVLTAELINILPLKPLAAEIARVLRPNGTWVNLGPLSYAHSLESLRYSPEEIQALLKEAGFKIIKTQRLRCPSHTSPNSVWTQAFEYFLFTARKTAAQPTVWPPPPLPISGAAEEERRSPQWLENPDQMLPALPPGVELLLRDGRSTPPLHIPLGPALVYVLALMQRPLSLREVAREVGLKFGLAEEEARAKIVRFLSRLHGSGE